MSQDKINRYIATLYIATLLGMIGVIGWFIQQTIYQTAQLDDISATTHSLADSALANKDKPHNVLIPTDSYRAGINLNIDKPNNVHN